MTYSAAAPVLVSRQGADHPVTDVEAGHVLAQRVDRARDVDAGGVRQSDRDGALHDAGADVALDRVERRRGHPDPDLADAGDRLVHVFVAQDRRRCRTRGNALPS